MKEHKPHELRVIEEAKDLGDKLDKLNELLEKDQPQFINDAEWSRLNRQSVAMTQYAIILKERIKNF